MRLGIRVAVARVATALLVATAGCALVDRVVPYPPPTGIDLNQAGAEEIADLPGLTATDAARIVHERPYATKDDVVRRGVVTREQFAAFADRVYVGRIDSDGGLISRARPTVLAPEEPR